MPRKPKSLALWGVWYIDPAFHLEDEKVEPCPILLVGFPTTMDDDRDFITFASEGHADGQHRQYTTIPKHAIKDLFRVKRVKVPEWVLEWRQRQESGD